MSDEVSQSVELRRIDPTVNARRFYRLALWPDLLGGASVVRQWGRIGQEGRVQMNGFPTPEQAEQMFRRRFCRNNAGAANLKRC
jgi:predicted DNA-binding WGR domain protein